MKRAGAVDWTVGRLLSLVLLIVVLILVVYGVSTNGLNPLIERAQGMIDSVLILFGMDDGEQDVDRECIITNESIGGVGKGVLVRCRDKCEIVLDEKIGSNDEFSLVFKSDSFGVSDAGVLMVEGVPFPVRIRDINTAIKEREIFKVLNKEFDEYVGDNKDSDENSFLDSQAILIRVAESRAKYYGVDREGQWSFGVAAKKKAEDIEVIDGGIVWEDRDWTDNDAVEKIYGKSSFGKNAISGGSYPGKSSWVVVSLFKALIFNSGYDYAKEKGPDEYTLIKWIIEKKKNELIPSYNKMQELKADISNRDDVEIFGKPYSFGVDEDDGSIVFYLDGDGKKYGLSRGFMYFSPSDVKIEYEFVAFWADGWGMFPADGSYASSDEDFEEDIKVFKLREFLFERC